MAMFTVRITAYGLYDIILINKNFGNSFAVMYVEPYIYCNMFDSK